MTELILEYDNRVTEEKMIAMEDHDLLIHLHADVSYIKRALEHLLDVHDAHRVECQQCFVRQEEFKPVKAVAFTLIGVVGISIITLIIHHVTGISL